MTSSKSLLAEQAERLDYLLSVEMDGELSEEERDELASFLTAHPEAASRRSHFESVDKALRQFASPQGRAAARGTDVSAGEAAEAATLEANFAALQARLGGAVGSGDTGVDGLDATLFPRSDRRSDLTEGQTSPAGVGDASGSPADELAARREDTVSKRSGSNWIPPVVLAAAAAAVLYFMVPTTSVLPTRVTLSPGAPGDAGSTISRAPTPSKVPTLSKVPTNSKDPMIAMESAARDRERPSAAGIPETMSKSVVLDEDFARSAFAEASGAVPEAGIGTSAAFAIETALLFELDRDSDGGSAIESASAQDFDVIERLDLIEFLIEEESGGRG